MCPKLSVNVGVISSNISINISKLHTVMPSKAFKASMSSLNITSYAFLRASQRQSVANSFRRCCLLLFDFEAVERVHRKFRQTLPRFAVATARVHWHVYLHHVGNRTLTFDGSASTFSKTGPLPRWLSCLSPSMVWARSFLWTSQTAHASLSRASPTSTSTSRSAFSYSMRCPSLGSRLPSLPLPSFHRAVHPIRPHMWGPLLVPAALVSLPLPCTRRHPPLHILCTCSRRGCSAPIQGFCSTGYCDSHRRSLRCTHHRPFALQPARPSRPVTRHPCGASGCFSLSHDRCFVGFCTAHCTSPRCNCRRFDCSGPVGFCNLHCTSRPVVCSTIPCPCRETVRGATRG